MRADATKAKALRANRDMSNPGVKLHGAGFIVTPEEAELGEVNSSTWIGIFESIGTAGMSLHASRRPRHRSLWTERSGGPLALSRSLSVGPHESETGTRSKTGESQARVVVAFRRAESEAPKHADWP